MKIQYTRYTELSCFTIRGVVGPSEFKMLQLGFDLLFKELEEILVLNLVNAQIAPELLPVMLEYKKNIVKLTKHKIYWITKDKGLGDFIKMELLLSRLQGSKFRSIGDRIILDDQIYELEQEIVSTEAQIEQLGFDESSSRKAIQQNSMVKTEKNSLEGCLKWQKRRKAKLQKIPSDIEELDLKIKATLEEVLKFLGRVVEL
jgi:hypothetical protein